MYIREHRQRGRQRKRELEKPDDTGPSSRARALVTKNDVTADEASNAVSGERGIG
jgi:hypothetical protein